MQAVIYQRDIGKDGRVHEEKPGIPKKPTRRQKIAMTNAGLKPENWKVAKDNGTSLELLSSGGRKREIPV